MRRSVLVVSMVLATGCGKAKLTDPNTVAKVGGTTLSAEQLASFLATAKGTQLNEESADFITNVWVDYTLFAQAAAKGDNLADSALIAEAMWPQLTELKATIWHDTLLNRRLNISDADIQAAYDKGENRLFQHVLWRIAPGGPPEARSAARRQATTGLGTLKRGANFAEFAGRESQDPGSARDGGFLPPGPMGRFVPTFDSAAWKLAPGEMTGLVETPFGYHIIRRPPFDEVKDRYKAFLGQAESFRLDSIYMDSLALQKKLTVKQDAAKLMKAAIADPDAHATSRKVLATYTGGTVDVQQYLRWVRVLPPQITGQLKAAPDSALDRFAKILGTNILLIKQADSAGIAIPSDQWKVLSDAFAAQVDSLEADMGLAGIADSSSSVSERVTAAGLRVDNYFQGIVTGANRMRPVPGSLAAALREKADVAFNDAGVKKALEIARGQRTQGDSAGAPAAGPAPAAPAAPGTPPAATGS
jgi:hypothetical protein